MAAPDTSFEPVPPREEGRPALGVREHPVSPETGDAGDSDWGYLKEVQQLAIEANLIDVLDARAVGRA
jgi:hypothetical protein